MHAKIVINNVRITDAPTEYEKVHYPVQEDGCLEGDELIIAWEREMTEQF